MARWIVEAALGQGGTDELGPYSVDVFVSVSRAEDGSAVTGLTAANFRICSYYLDDVLVETVEEAKWDVQDVDAAGCYRLILKNRSEGSNVNYQWPSGISYPIGIRARKDHQTIPPTMSTGQTVIQVGKSAT